MMLGGGPIGGAPIGSVGTAAGTSKAVGISGTVAVTLKMGGGAIHAGPIPQARSSQHSPPAAAEHLLCYLFPKSKRDIILGDLEEDYRTDLLPKFGPQTARRMYWSQFVRSLAATLPARVWAAIVGVLAWLGSKLGS